MSDIPPFESFLQWKLTIESALKRACTSNRWVSLISGHSGIVELVALQVSHVFAFPSSFVTSLLIFCFSFISWLNTAAVSLENIDWKDWISEELTRAN